LIKVPSSLTAPLNIINFPRFPAPSEEGITYYALKLNLIILSDAVRVAEPYSGLNDINSGDL